MEKISVKNVNDVLQGSLEEDGLTITDISSILKHIDLNNPKDLRKKIKQISQKIIKLKSSNDKEIKTAKSLYDTAVTDGLTDLKNRRYLDDVLGPELEMIEDLAYLMIDIDNFKGYNDTFGHQQGDRAITTIANIIQETSKKGTTIRYGGEEFSVILVEYQASEDDIIYENAENIRGNIEKTMIAPFSERAIINLIIKKIRVDAITEKQTRIAMNGFLNDSDTNFVNYAEKIDEYFGMFKICSNIESYLRRLQRITVSIGGAKREKGETVEELVNRADLALYEAKESRNKVAIAK